MRRVGATIRGFGDYKIAGNSIMRGGMTPPMITNSISNGAVIIRHREYLRDIYNSVDFENTSFDLNPGITASFPWLSQMAMSFAQYRFRGLVFEFKTTSSDTVLSSAASTSLGTVVMATQYNALDAPFTNKFEMENWEYSVSTKPSLSCMHPVECAKSQTPVSLLWTRNGPKAGDERLYDLGNFNIATVGMQGTAGTSSIGELWCSYEVEFYKPQFIEDSSTQSAIARQGMNPPTTGNPFGTLGPINTADFSGSNLSVIVTPSTRRISIPDCIAKRMLVTYVLRWGIAATLTSTPAWSNYVGCTPIGYLWGSSGGGPYTGFSSHVNGDIISSTGWLCCQTLIEITSDVCSFDLSAITWTGGAANLPVLTITEVAPDMWGPP